MCSKQLINNLTSVCRYQVESSLRATTENDACRLRGVKDNMNLTINDLRAQVEGLKEELVYMKSNHDEVRTT